ncbi:cytochrome P450 [Streptomyces sp. P1-3]|uniref:cytochrome P450 n=1 Tax=Streptomyces sp. P1-3 TaxID=3421658 RepID=UPI003D36FDD3
MTPPQYDSARADSALAPPPGCPAHQGLDAKGAVPLFGPVYESDPLRVFEQLRAEHGAVAPVRLIGDLPGWLVLGYREILEVARTPTRFSHDSRHWHMLKEGKVPPDNPLLPVIGWNPDRMTADGDDHRRLRDAITECLDRCDRRGLRRHVIRFTNQLADEFSAEGSADLLPRFAQQLPMVVLTQLFGMPEEYGPRLVDAAIELVKGTEKSIASSEYIKETLARLVARKRVDPGNDLATWVVEHPAGLSDAELVSVLWIVLLAANENTTGLLATTLRMVLTDQRFRASLAGGQMTVPDAVEHVLWDDPPTTVIPARWATSDTELGGRPIKAGDMLLLGVAAGNIDPAVRPDLEAPMYGNRSHLSFSGGPHECPGREIARAIVDTAIDALLVRLPDLHLAVDENELGWRATTWTRHLKSLPVQFAPRRPTLEAPDYAALPAGQHPPLPQPEPAAPPAGPVPPQTTGPKARRSWWSPLARWFRRR